MYQACKAAATVADLCAPFVAESALPGTGLEMNGVSDDDSDMPE